MSVVLTIYPVVTFASWIYFTHGRGNPMGFADISKPVEVVLAVAMIVYLTQLGRAGSARQAVVGG